LANELEGKFLGVTPINISKEDLKSPREFMRSSNASDWIKDNKMKRLVGALYEVAFSKNCESREERDYVG